MIMRTGTAEYVTFTAYELAYLLEVLYEYVKREKIDVPAELGIQHDAQNGDWTATLITRWSPDPRRKMGAGIAEAIEMLCPDGKLDVVSLANMVRNKGGGET
jgi:hypothetical protein